MISDCTNRYIIICSPEHKDRLLGWPAVLTYMGCLLVLSAIFSGLAVKMETDSYQFIATTTFAIIRNARYMWVYLLGKFHTQADSFSRIFDYLIRVTFFLF